MWTITYITCFAEEDFRNLSILRLNAQKEVNTINWSKMRTYVPSGTNCKFCVVFLSIGASRYLRYNEVTIPIVLSYGVKLILPWRRYTHEGKKHTRTAAGSAQVDRCQQRRSLAASRREFEGGRT